MEVSATFLVCNDCLQALANCDFSGLHYHLPPEEVDLRADQIDQGIRSIESSYGTLVPGEKEIEFDATPCECCGTRLSGYRHEAVTLAQEGAPA